MKKIVLFAISGFITLTACAQLESGSIYLNASGDFSYSSNDVEVKSDNSPDMTVANQRTVTIEPQFGFFFFDKLVFGVEIQSESARTKEDNDVFKTTSFLIGPFLRYYLDGEKFKPFIEGSAGAGHTKELFTTPSITLLDNRNKLSGFAFTAGGAYFFADVISIDFGITYESRTVDFSDNSNLPSGYKTRISGFGGNLGFSIYL